MKNEKAETDQVRFLFNHNARSVSNISQGKKRPCRRTKLGLCVLMNRNQQNKILVKFSTRDVSVYVAGAPAVKFVKSRVVSRVFLQYVVIKLTGR